MMVLLASFYSTFLPPFSMIVAQAIMTGMIIILKVVAGGTKSIFIYTTYRLLVGMLSLLPFAIYFEKGVATIGWKALVWTFMSALTGLTLGMGLSMYGLRDTNATLVAVFLNLIPIMTFIFSVIARFELLNLKTNAGRVKVVGVILGVIGSIIISTYKGKTFNVQLSHYTQHSPVPIKQEKRNFTSGLIMLIVSCASLSLWYLVQVQLLNVYPAKLRATTLMNMVGFLQSAILGLILTRGEGAPWRLKWDLQLWSILYAGVAASAMMFWLVSWAVAQKGPAYPSMFNPLTLIFVMLIESLFMDGELSVGGLLGTFIIIVGLYAFLWGKGREPSPAISAAANNSTVATET